MYYLVEKNPLLLEHDTFYFVIFEGKMICIFLYIFASKEICMIELPLLLIAFFVLIHAKLF